MKLTPLQSRNIQYFLFEKGHAEPEFVGDYIHYRDQTPGKRAMYVRVKIQDILDQVDELSLKDIDKLLGKKTALEEYLELYGI